MIRPEKLLALIGSLLLGGYFVMAALNEAKETKRQDKIYAESSTEQKLDLIYQQNKELKKLLEECRIWILAK